MVAAVAQRSVGLPAVGVHGRPRLDRLLDERQQALGPDIGYLTQPDASKSLGVLDLRRDRDDRLGLGLAVLAGGLDPPT